MSKQRGNSILGATSWQTAAQLAPLVVNLALTPFVILSLGREAYGLWLVTTTLTQFIGQVDGGIGRTVLRYFTRFLGYDHERTLTETGRYARSLTVLVLGISVVVLVPPFLFAGSVVDFFHAPPEHRDGMIVMLRAALLAVSIALWRQILVGVLNANRRFALTAITNLASYATYALTVLLTLPTGLGLYGMAVASLAQTLIATCFIVPAALKLMRVRGVGWMTRTDLKDFFSIAWKLQISGLLNVLSFQGVTLIVGRAAPTQVSDFGPGATFAQQMRQLPFNAIAPVQATLGGILAKDGREVATGQFVRMQHIWVMVIVGWTAVGAPAAMNGVNTWLPLEGTLAGTIAALLMLSHFFVLLSQVLLQWLMHMGRTEGELAMGVVGAGLTVGLSALTVSHLGALSVALSAVVAQVVAFIVLQTIAHRQGLVPRSPLREIPWVAGLVCGALSWLVTGAIAHAVGDGPFHGAIGLLLVAAGAGPVFLLYLVWTVGPARTLQIIRTRSLK